MQSPVSPSPRKLLIDRTVPKKWIIICSAVSGKKKGRELVEKTLLPLLRFKGVDASVMYTEYAQHAVQLAKNFGNAETGLIAVGGDGTINEILKGLSDGEKLKECVVGIMSQGTMNFYSVCAGLPSTPKQLVSSLMENQFRWSSLMKVNTEKRKNLLSFEAAHIGLMAYHVCLGAQEWRFTLGPMFGIFLHLLLRNATPQSNITKGELKIYPINGTSPITVAGDFFWIIITHRNPYNGVVGKDCVWVSYMTLQTFPGFGRMMEFFEPPMEHFQGTSRCFGNHMEACRVEFTLRANSNGNENVPLVLDGDPMVNCGKQVEIDNLLNATRIVASKKPPANVDGKYFKPKSLTKHAQQWLTMNPPPSDVLFPSPKGTDSRGAAGKGGIVGVLMRNKKKVFVLLLIIMYWLKRRV